MPETKHSAVKDKLHSVRRYDLAAKEALAQYESILSDITRITPAYGGVHVKSSGGDDFSAGIERLREASSEALLRYRQYADAKAEAAEIIAAMGEWPDEMQCLRLRYLDYRSNAGWRLTSWDEVAERMSVSRRQATNIHGQALRHFAEIWDKLPQA